MARIVASSSTGVDPKIMGTGPITASQKCLKKSGWTVDDLDLIGASGTRILVTLLHEMKREDAKKGLATLCIGGGMGIALAVERTYFLVPQSQ